MLITIKPKTGFNGELTSLNYYIINDGAHTGSSCTLFYSLSGTAETVNKNITISGEDYDSWDGSNDALKALVLKMVKAEEVEAPAEAPVVEAPISEAPVEAPVVESPVESPTSEEPTSQMIAPVDSVDV